MHPASSNMEQISNDLFNQTSKQKQTFNFDRQVISFLVLFVEQEKQYYKIQWCPTFKIIMQRTKYCLNILFAIGAIFIALYAIFAYGILTEWLVPLGARVHQDMRRQFQLEKPAIYIHALSSAIALAIGPFQVIAYFRSKYLGAHRWAGRTYVIFAIIGSVTSIIVGQKAQGGISGVISFSILGVLWLISTLIGFVAIAFYKNIWVHELSMQISVALSYSAVSIRILLPIAVLTNFQIGYAIVSWLSWTINLLVLFILRQKFKVDQNIQSQERLQS